MLNKICIVRGSEWTDLENIVPSTPAPKNLTIEKHAGFID